MDEEGEGDQEDDPVSALVVPPVRAPRGVVAPQPFTPPAQWEQQYYDEMHQMGRDTLPPSIAQRLGGRVAALPYHQLQFYTADSIPAHLGLGYGDEVGSVSGLFDPGTKSIGFVNHGPHSPLSAAGDSIQGAAVQHEMAHAILGHAVDHRHPIFAQVLQNPAYWGLR